MMRDGSLVLQPSFQRKLVWNNKHKENFIQTILMGLPFPEIYLSDGEIDLENMKSKTLVVDGQQRMNTIYQYITNDDELVLKNTKRFNQLTEEEKQDFLDYPVVVRALGRISLGKIKEIFNRINSVQYALNAMEINNALYEGEFISTAKKIVDTKLLGDLDILSETEISRMKDLEFVTLLMATIELGGYFTGNKEVENMIKDIETRLSYQGIKLEQYLQMLGKTAEEMKKEYEPQAIEGIKSRLALEAVIKAEKIEATEDEITHLHILTLQYASILDM